MSNNLKTYPFAAALALAILLVPAGDAAAQSQIPLEDIDLLEFVVAGPQTWVAPVALKAELEAATGKPSTLSSAGALFAQLPPADGVNSVRFEGCFPVNTAVASLEARGYVLQSEDDPVLPSAGIAVLRR